MALSAALATGSSQLSNLSCVLIPSPAHAVVIIRGSNSRKRSKKEIGVVFIGIMRSTHTASYPREGTRKIAVAFLLRRLFLIYLIISAMISRSSRAGIAKVATRLARAIFMPTQVPSSARSGPPTEDLVRGVS